MLPGYSVSGSFKKKMHTYGLTTSVFVFGCRLSSSLYWCDLYLSLSLSSIKGSKKAVESSGGAHGEKESREYNEYCRVFPLLFPCDPFFLYYPTTPHLGQRHLICLACMHIFVLWLLLLMLCFYRAFFKNTLSTLLIKRNLVLYPFFLCFLVIPCYKKHESQERHKWGSTTYKTENAYVYDERNETFYSYQCPPLSFLYVSMSAAVHTIITSVISILRKTSREGREDESQRRKIRKKEMKNT